MKPSFKLKSAILVMALASIYPLQGHTAAGVAQFTSGDVNVRRGAAVVALAKGRDVESGDAIVTGPNGRAQLRFTDGGIVSLQPDSQFAITNYVDANNGAQDSFLVNFARGSMRAITGLIGKRSRENYKVQTATATVGIRGTGFSASYNPDGSMSITAELGEIEVCTAGGCTRLTAGESALVVSNDQPPVRTQVRAQLPTPAPRQEVTVSGNRVSAGGLSAIVTDGAKTLLKPPVVLPVPPVLPVIEVVGAPWLGSVVSQNISGSQPASDIMVLPNLDINGVPAGGQQFTLETFNGKTQLNKFTGSAGETSLLEKTAFGSFDSVGQTADADFLGWGHWSTGNAASGYVGGSTVKDLHYIVGKPTPDSAMMSLAGFTGTFSTLGGTASFTAAYTGASQVGTVLAGVGGLTANFNGASATVNGSVTTQFGATQVPVFISTFEGSGARFSCSFGTKVAGFFTGANATRAGLVFSTNSTGSLGAGVLSGSAAFQRTNLVAPN